MRRWLGAGGRGLAGWMAVLAVAHGSPWILHLKSGDRLTGEIVAENSERLVLKSSQLGRIKVPLAEIDHREDPTAAKPAASPAAPAAPAVAAVAAKPLPTAAPAPASATNTAAKSSTPIVVGLTNAPALAWLIPGWVRPLMTNWHGNVQLGMDLGFGTADRQTFYANANLTHAYDRFRNNISLRSAYGIAESPVSVATPSGSVQTANSLEGSWKTDFDLGKLRKIYLYHQTGAGFDEIRRYNLRFEEGAGLGYKLIDRPRLKLNTEMGGQYQHLTYLNGSRFLPFLPDHDTFSIRVGENLTWKASEKLSITQRLQITPNVQDVGDFRARFDLSMSYPLLKRVTLSLNVFDEYEARPAGLVEKNQLQIQSTVGITF